MKTIFVSFFFWHFFLSLILNIQSTPIEISFKELIILNQTQSSMIFSNPDEYLSLNCSIDLNRSLDFINTNSKKMEFRFLNGSINITENMNVSFINFVFIINNIENLYVFTLIQSSNFSIKVIFF